MSSSTSKGLLANLWEGIEPKNTLHKSFFVSSQYHTYFRWLLLIINTITFVWTVIVIPAEFGLFAMSSYLTVWGFFFCFAYSAFVILWNKAPDGSLKWKITYIVGEIAFALEVMICPFYFAVVFPIRLPMLSFWGIIHEMAIHLVVPILMWVEVIFNDLAFPKRHMLILHIVMVAYLLNNLVWTLVRNCPVYEPVDWVTFRSYIIKTLGLLAALGGFTLGGSMYRWKNKIHQHIYNKTSKKIK